MNIYYFVIKNKGVYKENKTDFTKILLYHPYVCKLKPTSKALNTAIQISDS